MEPAASLKQSQPHSDALQIQSSQHTSLAPNKLLISSFEADGMEHTFETPLVINVEKDDETGIDIATNDELRTCVYVEPGEDLLQEVMADLAWRWTSIALANEDGLAKDALAVREAFLQMVAD